MNNNTTINTTELRHNLDDVLDKVAAGQEVVVTHRFKSPVVIRSVALNNQPQTANKKPLAGLRAFLHSSKHPSPYAPHTSIKELYHESLNKKYDA